MRMAFMVDIMRIVQVYEFYSAGEPDGLCRAIRRLVEGEAELTGCYTELMERIGED